MQSAVGFLLLRQYYRQSALRVKERVTVILWWVGECG